MASCSYPNILLCYYIITTLCNNNTINNDHYYQKLIYSKLKTIQCCNIIASCCSVVTTVQSGMPMERAAHAWCPLAELHAQFTRSIDIPIYSATYTSRGLGLPWKRLWEIGKIKTSLGDHSTCKSSGTTECQYDRKVKTNLDNEYEQRKGVSTVKVKQCGWFENFYCYSFF